MKKRIIIIVVDEYFNFIKELKNIKKNLKKEKYS
tara:strand:- start:1793 stop:1894 length:102 start_codon:yes stop_codon:yes gene_type:complete